LTLIQTNFYNFISLFCWSVACQKRFDNKFSKWNRDQFILTRVGVQICISLARQCTPSFITPRDPSFNGGWVKRNKLLLDSNLHFSLLNLILLLSGASDQNNNFITFQKMQSNSNRFVEKRNNTETSNLVALWHDSPQYNYFKRYIWIGKAKQKFSIKCVR